MREEGIVKRELGGLCEVVVRRKTACGDNCASCGGACRMNFQQVMTKNPIGAKAGDSVIIEMESKKVLLSAFLVYILPILVFFVSFFTVQKIYASNNLASGISAILTVAVFGITVLFDRRHKEDFLPSIIKICENT
ncbi:MAG: SoxR reducing system RseC family protein [Firmicutes bacterium]|nr:SoxR reducing system RseC family protein [Bacillota bacterium]